MFINVFLYAALFFHLHACARIRIFLAPDPRVEPEDDNILPVRSALQFILHGSVDKHDTVE